MDFFTVDPRLEALCARAEADCAPVFARINAIAEYNQQKILRAFSDNRISEAHLLPTTGYGYGDRGRDTLDEVYAQIFGCEDALVRHNFVSGTHALSTALFGVLRPGDVMLAVTGKPYDTLEEVIGLRGSGNGSLKDFGVLYDQVDLLENGEPDYEAIAAKAAGVKMVYIQRSRGYALRPSLTVETIGKIARTAKEANPDVIVAVDNCYGEFVEKQEPTQVGADMIVGSLIKNPGGGIALTGGYIAGRRDLVELCSYRLTAVGAGKEVGASLGQNRPMYMGLFFAPTVVGEAVKTSVFAARLFELLGFDSTPAFDAPRTDIIQALTFHSPEGLVAFCRGIQKGSPIDAFVAPEPWDMPGYSDPVIMAAGAFTMGASIELSADGPLREPYSAWMQGGLTYFSGKTGVMLAAQSLLEEGLLSFPA